MTSGNQAEGDTSLGRRLEAGVSKAQILLRSNESAVARQFYGGEE